MVFPNRDEPSIKMRRVPNPVVHEFHARGGIEIVPTWHGLPFHQLVITQDQASIQSLFGRTWAVARAETIDVEYRRVRLVLFMRTLVIFRTADGRRIPPFVSWRPRRVLAALRDLGWPVRETGSLREAVRRLRRWRAGEA
jgi:hypothetical protein